MSGQRHRVSQRNLDGFAAGLTTIGSRVIKNTSRALYRAGSRLKSTGRRTAINTTIHGIRDAYRGNWISRVFFVIVFVCCLTAMAFQLKGIFHGYRTEAVGTRVTAAGTWDANEIPSIYYCNKYWLPMVDAIAHFNYTDPTVPDGRKYKECVHGAVLVELTATEFIEHEPADDCRQYLEYWKHMMKQEIVNSILSPPEHEVSDQRQRKYRPKLYYYAGTLIAGAKLKFRWHYAERFALDLVYQHIGKLFNSLWLDKTSLKESVRKIIQNVTFGEVRFAGKTKRTVYYSATSSKTANDIVEASKSYNLDAIFEDFNFRHSTELRKVHLDVSSHSRKLLSEIKRLQLFWEDRHFNRTIPHERFSLSLDGLCWEHPLRTQPHATTEVGGNRHFVVHLGGMAHQLRKLIEWNGAIEHGTRKEWGEVEVDQLGKFSKAVVKTSLMTALNFAGAIDDDYHTNIAVSRRAAPSLYFKQKVRVDSDNQLVILKFWKKTNIRLNRGAWSCKPAPWTEHDQAHCNQNIGLRYNSDICETYLPASGNYPETKISRDTCIYDTTGIFKDLFFAVRPETRKRFLSSSKAYNTTNRSLRRDVIANLTKSNRDYPQPCSSNEFVYQINYPFRTKNDIEVCHRALAHLLTPIIYKRSSSAPSSHLWFRYAFAVITEHFGRDTPYCSVVEYEHMESLGQTTEEYFIYSLPDVAANLGGTLGLWIGASVISIVQMVYLCCLKNLFRGTWRKMKFRRGGRSVAPASKRTGQDSSCLTKEEFPHTYVAAPVFLSSNIFVLRIHMLLCQCLCLKNTASMYFLEGRKELLALLLQKTASRAFFVT